MMQLLLSVLEARPRHGYELGKLIETQSGGRLVFHLDSLYPLLYRLEERGWIKGAWVEKAGERRRRFYRLTPTESLPMTDIDLSALDRELKKGAVQRMSREPSNQTTWL